MAALATLPCPEPPLPAQAWLIIAGRSGALCLHSWGFLFSHWSARAWLHSPWSCLGELAQPCPGHCSVPCSVPWQRLALWDARRSLEPSCPIQGPACPLGAAEQRHSPLGAPLVPVCAGGATRGLAPAPQPSEPDISFMHLSQGGTPVPAAGARLRALLLQLG